jgi:hypothetical protein
MLGQCWLGPQSHGINHKFSSLFTTTRARVIHLRKFETLLIQSNVDAWIVMNHSSGTSSSDAGHDSTIEAAPHIPLSGKSQVNVLMYIPMGAGCLSLVGSSLILLSIYRSRNNSRRRTGSSNSVFRSRTKGQTSQVYHRIVGVMSIYDIIYTLFGGLFNPQETFTHNDGHGTRFTCTLQGFFIQWGYGCFAYGAWLSVYYVLTIRYNLPEATLARYVEPVIHSSVFLFYFGTALIASVVGLMNPGTHSVCWIVPYPLSCTSFDVPCVRGVRFKQAILWMILVPSSVSVLFILVCLVMVIQTVWHQRKIVRKLRNRLPQSEERIAGTSSSRLSTDATVQPTAIAQEPQPAACPAPQHGTGAISTSVERRTNEAIGQCIFFGCTFVNSVIWTNIMFGFAIADKPSQRDIYWVRFVLLFHG